MSNENRSIPADSANTVGVLLNRDRQAAEAARRVGPDRMNSGVERCGAKGDATRLFAIAERWPTPLPERYPRLTFLAISLALLVSALAMELECLRGAGYFWR